MSTEDKAIYEHQARAGVYAGKWLKHIVLIQVQHDIEYLYWKQATNQTS